MPLSPESLSPCGDLAEKFMTHRVPVEVTGVLLACTGLKIIGVFDVHVSVCMYFRVCVRVRVCACIVDVYA